MFLLSEKVKISTWLAIFLAICGIVVMQGGTTTGQWTGSLFALFSAFAFAVYTIILRWNRSTDITSALFMSGVFSIIIFGLVSIQFGNGPGISSHDLAVSLLMGAFQTGIGSRTVPAVQLALLPLVEIVLGPLWVTIFIGEIPALTTLFWAYLLC